MAALATVADYLSEARTLLQDTVVPYRYSDADIVSGLNLGFLEARRLRPDIFRDIPSTVPSYSSVSPSDAVVMDAQYRSALLYYVVGHTNLRDQEESQDQRASAFLNKFVSQMLSVTA